MNKYLENAEVRDFYGYKHYVFDFNGHEANVILPHEPKGNLWIWRAEFLNCGFDWVDMEMLRRGYPLMYYRICDMYGCPAAVELMDSFYRLMTEEFGYAKKTAFYGFSRGGLYSAHFALAYPERCAALYLDAPVLDIKSWPGGLGVGLGAEREWAECLECFGLDRSTVLSWKGNPTDRVAELAENGIPVVMVVGDSDRDVPHRENAEVLVAAYEAAGEEKAPLLYIVKPGCDHHPHSLEDPTPVADFLEKYLAEKNS
ncbi:MAG: alpha/beta hydrolase [Clostridia bacterium]|nr:alpha/beta hydrolase [Clostridia bacterium]